MKPLENICHRYECEVAFSETDAGGLVHFSKTLIYLERAEHDFLASLGITVFDPSSGGWPRVRIVCDYRAPLMFQDKVEVRLSLTKAGNSSLHWRFEMFKGETLVAEGEMVTVKVDLSGTPTLLSSSEREKLEAQV